MIARSLGIDSFDAIEESLSHIVYRVEDAGVQNIGPPFFFELVQLSAEQYYLSDAAFIGIHIWKVEATCCDHVCLSQIEYVYPHLCIDLITRDSLDVYPEGFEEFPLGFGDLVESPFPAYA